jgi:hypothetical protein
VVVDLNESLYAVLNEVLSYARVMEKQKTLESEIVRIREDVVVRFS